MYKMMAIDLDGTLLNDEKEMSKEDIYWINKAYKEKGIMPVITTGRDGMSAGHFAKMLGEGIVKYIVVQNGAIIKDVINNEYVNFIPINNDVVKESINILKSNNLLVNLETENEIISDQVRTKEEMELRNKMGDKIKFVEDLINYDISNENITTVAGVGEKENLLKAIEELKKIKSILVIPISKFLAKNGEYVYERYFIEFNASGATKGNGISTLSEHLKIKKGEIIIIGDGNNDASMFEMAGLKVAMGNGEEELKDKADYVTTSNNESGVAHAIKHILF